MDVRLHFTERGHGNGRVLLLLHHSGESGAYFTDRLDFFSNIFHVIAIDLRGHGGSERGECELTLARLAEDILEFMNEYNIDRADILGVGTGANIALLLALKYPELVRHLVLCCANLLPSGLKLRVRLGLELEYRTFASQSRRELLRLTLNEPQIAVEELNELSIPVLVMSGSRDDVRPTHTRLIADSIPNSKLIFFRGKRCGMSPSSVEINFAVAKFLADGRIF